MRRKTIEIEAIAEYFDIPLRRAELRLETISSKRLDEILAWYWERHKEEYIND